jgi:hypothetical protein
MDDANRQNTEHRRPNTEHRTQKTEQLSDLEDAVSFVDNEALEVLEDESWDV